MDKPIKLEIAQSDIDVLKLMVKHYDERGGGYSQKEALRLAIKALESWDDREKWLKSKQMSVEEIYAELFDLVNTAEHLRSEERVNEIIKVAEAIHTEYEKRLEGK